MQKKNARKAFVPRNRLFIFLFFPSFFSYFFFNYTIVHILNGDFLLYVLTNVHPDNYESVENGHFFVLKCIYTFCNEHQRHTFNKNETKRLNERQYISVDIHASCLYIAMRCNLYKKSFFLCWFLKIYCK